MLELLARYALEHGLHPEPGFSPKDVRWAIVCDDSGRFLNVIELGDPTNKRNRGREFGKCPDLTQSEMVSGGGTKSHFLADSASVVTLFGLADEDPDAQRKTQKKHAYFTGLLAQASQSMPELEVIARMIDTQDVIDEIRRSLEEHKAKPTDRVSFRVGEVFPLESSAWHDWWRGFRVSISHKATNLRSTSTLDHIKPEPMMRCFISGDLVTAAKTHSKIRGLSDVGGSPPGDVIIGFDKDAFQSFGLEQSLNAACSETACTSYSCALNRLLRESSYRLPGVKVVHWFKEATRQHEDPLGWLQGDDVQTELNAREMARKTLASIRSGERPDLSSNRYYCLGLSGMSGRVMVRDWVDGQFEELVANVNMWFDDLQIVQRDGSGIARPPKFVAVLGSTVRDLKDLNGPLVTRMWRVALKGEEIPHPVLAQALSRCRIAVVTDQPVNLLGLGLMRAYHLRKYRKGGVKDMSMDPCLNRDHPSPAYQAGRLMAVLARVQRAALGDVGAGVVQRYYAAASTTPALVIGRLVRTSQFHLNKMDQGLSHWFEGHIQEVMSHLGNNIPRTLTLEQQSLFALGYYQQLAEFAAKKTSESREEN